MIPFAVGAYNVRMRHIVEPLSLTEIRKEVDELLFLIQRLDRRVVNGEAGVRQELEVKLVEARHQLGDLIIQRTV